MEKLQLVFVPLPGIGHLISMVEAAKLLLNRHNHLSITVLILKLSHSDSKFNNFIDSIAASTTTTLSNRIRFIDLPNAEPEISNFATSVERQKPHVKEIVSKMTQSESTSDSPRLAGFVLDMFCTPIIDVANEFGVPSYIFFTSSAAFLGFVLHLLEIHDEKRVDPTEEFKDSDAELALPSFVNPFPARVLPYGVLSKERLPILLNHIRRFRETKGIIVNTFVELESYAMQSFSDGILPPVYPVGPILNVGSDGSNNKQQEIIQWLDDQPTSSVVFLCFGSRGSFSVEQVKEIACALEHSGHRFLWSLRRPPSTGRFEFPNDDEDPQKVVLPEGFLDRTAEIGKIIGWAPQAAILAHPAVGGFVSHCGWNSILESIWYGVPIATWPLYAEQQFNAFEMVIELQLGVEIKMDYRMESGTIINSDEIERGIWCVMEQNNEQRKKLKEMSESSRKTLINGGSSYIWLDHLIKDVIDNIV